MGWGGAREGSGRKKSENPKDVRIFGYKYTTQEAELIRGVLEEIKKEKKTTSASILEVFQYYKQNKLD